MSGGGDKKAQDLSQTVRVLQCNSLSRLGPSQNKDKAKKLYIYLNLYNSNDVKYCGFFYIKHPYIHSDFNVRHDLCVIFVVYTIKILFTNSVVNPALCLLGFLKVVSGVLCPIFVNLPKWKLDTMYRARCTWAPQVAA